MIDERTKYEDYKIVIALPSGDFLHNKFFNSFYNLLIHSGRFVTAGVSHIASSRIAYNRNYLVDQAQKFGATHMLFIDADSIVPSDALLKLLDYKKDIVCASTCHRSDEFEHALIGTFVNQEVMMDTSQLTEATIIGMPLMLIDMKVFDKLEKPYFAEPPGDSGDIIPEDAYFCTKVRDAGYKIWCDMDLSTQIGHVGTKVYQVKTSDVKELPAKLKVVG